MKHSRLPVRLQLSGVCLFACCLLCSALSAQTIYLHCGRLIVHPDSSVRTAVTLMARNGLVERIDNGYVEAPAGVEVLDLRNYTVLPGLIDCHVHLENEQSRQSYSEKYTLNDADIAFRAAVFARRTLAAGFTTVRDLGGRGINISLRNAIEKGLVEGPRILTAGKAISVTGGHGDPTNGARWDLYPEPGPEKGVADGPDQCRKAVREQVQRGADWIKVTATGGVLSLNKDGRLPHYSENELETIVRTARDLGIPVAAHAHGDEGIRRASEAGVTSIEHGTFMSEATMDVLIKNKTWLVPTVTAGFAVSDSARLAPGFFPEMVRVKALGIGPQIRETLGKAYRKGVRIAFGTDAGVFPHGRNGLEFGLMADAGMNARDILRAATSDAALMLGLHDHIGALRPGFAADLVAVEGNPLQDIRVLQYIHLVLKGGRVFRAAP